MSPADLAGRRLYLCTPDRPDLPRFVEACLRGGVDVVQLRDKGLEARPLLAALGALGPVCAAHGAPLIVNDRPDLALAAGADGVHLGQDDVGVGVARRILGPTAIVGRSTHGDDDLARAQGEAVDYLSAGPVVPTPTKPGRPGTGTDYLARAVAAEAAREDPRPVFVTGGVTPDTVGDLARSGARHFVVVRYLTEASDPEAAARRLRAAVDRALATGA